MFVCGLICSYTTPNLLDQLRHIFMIKANETLMSLLSFLSSSGLHYTKYLKNISCVIIEKIFNDEDN